MNKRPKGPHIVHLSTMCNLYEESARAAILFFPISPKNTNLVEDVEISFPVKFHWILFNRFRREVENVSAHQRPGRPSCFSDRPEKHKLGRGRWDLVSCQVSLNSVQQFQRRSRKCLSQSDARAAILFFRSAEKHKLGRGCWDLASCMSSFVEFRSAVSEEKSKMSQPIRGHGGHLVFPIGPKNTNLVEDVEILLPVKFRWIPFSLFRGEVENVISQSEARAAILFFRSAQNTQTW